jgi:hypothetical protein
MSDPNRVKALKKRMLNRLPLAPEPLSSWTEDSDIFKFFIELHEGTGIVIGRDQQEQKVQYADAARGMFGSLHEHFRSVVADAFASYPLLPVSEQPLELSTSPALLQSPQFGQFAKYYIAWHGIVQEIVTEERFISLAHLLESKAHLDAATVLASRRFYRQSTALMRIFLEEQLASLYLSSDHAAYTQWLDGRLRLPPVRSDKGLLAILEKKGYLSDHLAKEVGRAYAKLNGIIHGEQAEFEFSGLHAGAQPARVANSSRFSKWVAVFSQAVRLAIEVADKTETIGLESSLADPARCKICRCGPLRTIRRDLIAGHDVLVLQCNTCGYQVYRCAQSCPRDHSLPISFCNHDRCRCLGTIWYMPPVFYPQPRLSSHADA